MWVFEVLSLKNEGQMKKLNRSRPYILDEQHEYHCVWRTVSQEEVAKR